MQPYYGNMWIKIPYVRKKRTSAVFALSAIAMLLLASSPMLLSPFTMSVFAQTETDTGDVAATMGSGANDTAAGLQMQLATI